MQKRGKVILGLNTTNKSQFSLTMKFNYTILVMHYYIYTSKLNNKAIPPPPPPPEFLDEVQKRYAFENIMKLYFQVKFSFPSLLSLLKLSNNQEVGIARTKRTTGTCYKLAITSCILLSYYLMPMCVFYVPSKYNVCQCNKMLKQRLFSKIYFGFAQFKTYHENLNTTMSFSEFE